MMTSTMRGNNIRHSIRKAARIGGVFIFWIFLWYIAARLADNEFIIPTPASTAARLFELSMSDKFWIVCGLSFLRVAAGFLLGLIFGVIFACASSAGKIADAFLSPAIRVVRAVPVASFIILALLWIDYSNVPVFISMLTVIPIVWLNIKTGIGSTDKQLIELAESFSFSLHKKVRMIYIPSVMPYFYSACSTGMGMAWKSAVAAEVLCQPKNSIGAEIYYSKIYLETPSLFAWTIAVILMSFIIEKGFGFVMSTRKRSLSRGTM